MTPHKLCKFGDAKPRFALSRQSQSKYSSRPDAIERAVDDSISRCPRQSHFRNQRDTQSSLYHRDHCTDLGAATADFGMESLGFTKLLGLSTQTMAILHENEFFVLQIAGDYFLLLNQRVCRRQTEQEFLA